MRTAILGLLALLLAGGCGGETDLGTSSLPRSEPTGNVWKGLQKELRELEAGSYSAALVSQRCSKASVANCTLTSQAIRNEGSFSLDPVTVRSEVTVDSPASESVDKDEVVQLRELADGSLFLTDVSGPSPCWRQLDRSHTATFEGAFRDGLAVLRSAAPSYDLPSSGRATEIPAQANALAVIRTLGLPKNLDATYEITPAVRKALAARTVTITLTAGPGGAPLTFQVDGRQVEAELRSGDADIAGAFLSTVQDAWSTFSLTDFDASFEVTAPPAAELCPAR